MPGLAMRSPDQTIVRFFMRDSYKGSANHIPKRQKLQKLKRQEFACLFSPGLLVRQRRVISRPVLPAKPGLFTADQVLSGLASTDRACLALPSATRQTKSC